MEFFSNDCNFNISFDVIACDSYDWNGMTFTESGIYSITEINSVGYDSTTTLNLTINQGPETVIFNGDVSNLNNCDGLALVETPNSSSTGLTYQWNNQAVTSNTQLPM